MKQLLQQFSMSHRVTSCPRCKKRLRFPIKKNQTLRITCPHCKTQFDICFVNPLSAVLSGKTKFSQLPSSEKSKLIFLAISFSILLFMIVGAFFAEPYPKKDSLRTKLTEELPL